MRSRALLLLLLITALVRLVPTLITNQPFSTDVWPLMKLSEGLLTDPDVRVWNDSVLGGYHNRWPAVLLDATIYSRLTGLSPRYFFTYIGVVATSISLTLTTYLLVRRCAGPHAALLSSLVLTSIPSFTMFTSATLKEVYSYPLATTSITLASKDFRGPTVAILVLVFITLTMSHPLTPLMTVVFTSSYVFVVLVKRLEGLRPSTSSVRKASLAALVLCSTYTAYMLVYGWEGLKYKLGPSDLLVLSAFGVAVYGWYAILGRNSARLSLILILPAVITATLTGIRVPADYSIALYVTPLTLLLTLLLATGRGCGDPSSETTPLTLPIVVAVLYVTLASPPLTSIIHRILNYLTLTAVMTPVILVRRGGIPRACVTAVVLVSLLVGVTSVVNAAVYGDSLTFYWRYGESEVIGLSHLVKYVGDAVLCGDAKIQYLLSPGLSAGIVCGFRFTQGYITNTPTVLYTDNFRFGYVLSPLDVYSIKGLNCLSMSKNLLYSNDRIFILR